jgi:site-specific DNA-methyltransferase (adenine-specific)
MVEQLSTLHAPSTEEAKQWDGWGTALKPALEPIVMARKPLDGTVAQNVLKHGVGGINIDESRIDFISEEDKGDPLRFQTNSGSGSHGIFNASKDVTSVVGEKGRWPANVIHDGSDEVVSLFPDTNPSSSGGISSGRNFGQNYDDGSIKKLPRTGHDDNGGSAARFFYTAKASKEERNFGLYDFEKTKGFTLMVKVILLH